MKKYQEVLPESHHLRRDLTDKQIQSVISLLTRFYIGEQIADRNTVNTIRNANDLSEVFGLAFTSSSAFAALWNTNSEVEFVTGQYIQGFTLDVFNRVLVYTHDADEQEKWFSIGYVFADLSDVRHQNAEHGLHFFAKKTMQFFASEVESSLYAGRYFITSEKTGFSHSQRAYTIREVSPFADINTVREFAKIDSLSLARAQARELVTDAKRVETIHEV
jgi:hypothetical protein